MTPAAIRKAAIEECVAEIDNLPARVQLRRVQQKLLSMRERGPK